MKVIIVGGGRLGKQLANTIPDSVIIECDKGKIPKLVNTYGESRVIEGTGTSEESLRKAGIEESSAMVIATNNDHTNYIIAVMAEKFKVPKVVVRVDDPDNVDTFHQIGIETVICPAIIATKMINSALYPDAREVSEIHVFEDSPLKGRKIREISLSEDAMVAAVLRGHNLMKPAEDLIMEKGDHLIVCSTGRIAPAAEELIEGGEEKLRAFDSILAVLRNEEDLSVVLPETLFLAGSFDIDLIVASPSQSLLDRTDQRSREAGVEVTLRQINTEGLGELGWLCQNDLSHVGCVALSPVSNGKRQRVESKEVVRFIRSSPVPILLCKGTAPYSKIVTIMGADEICERSASIALKMALLSGADIHVMNYRDPEDIEQCRMLQIKRLGKMYDINIIKEPVEGNPTIEFVSRVTSDRFDLAVINWDSLILKKDVLRRMFFEAPMSILVYTR
jgi:trk system potassium uptake protein TrkA